MKILHTVEFYHPSVGGMQEVVKQLSERLVKLGHDVTVATTKLSERTTNVLNGVNIQEFAVSGNSVRGLHGEVEAYRRFLLESQFDVITNFAAQQWATDVMLPILGSITARKVFVPTGFSGLFLPEYKEYFSEMGNWLKQYDMNVFLSDDYRDINFAKENGVENTRLIPNGAGADEFLNHANNNIRERLGICAQDFLILNVGSHTGVKGHAEAIRIFNKADIPNSVLLIVANTFGGGCTLPCKLKEWINKVSFDRLLKNKRIIITALSRPDTVLAYQAADLFLFPSNIECSPIVLFECMASRTPFLTTDVGNAKEIIEWSNAGVLLPTKKTAEGLSKAEISASVEIVERVVSDRQWREKMANNGFDAWMSRFTWEKITEEYQELYVRLVRD